MAHLALVKSANRGRGPEAPVGGEEKQEVVALAMPLTQFENRLASGHVVAAVAVDEHDPAKTVVKEVLRESVEQIEIHARRGGKRAGKFEVVIRVAQPHQRREKTPADPLRHAADDLAEQQAVREHRQVMSVLFERGHRNHHRRPTVQFIHRAP